jgi:hypothetical protein
MKDYKSVEIMIKPKQVLRLFKLKKIYYVYYKSNETIESLDITKFSLLLNQGNITKVSFYNSFGDSMTLKVNYETLESETV